jgi:hypothetical protein
VKTPIVMMVDGEPSELEHPVATLRLRYNRTAAELWGRSPRPDDLDERFCGS